MKTLLQTLLLLFFGIVLFTGCEESVGDVGLSSGTELLLIGKLAGEHFGSSVDFIGDLNGDGKGDIVVGAPDNSQGGVGAGAVYVYLSPLTATSTPLTILGLAGEHFGQTVAGPGDLDGDGLDDLAIGAAGKEPGRVYVFKGRSATGLAVVENALSSGNADLIIESGSIGQSSITVAGFGAVIAAAGDINRDGRLDLAVGAPQSRNTAGEHQGVALVFYGGLSLAALGSGNQQLITAASAELRLIGEAGSDFGAAISHAGDPDGNFGAASSSATRFGDDLLIGAPSANRVYLLLGIDGTAGLFSVLSYPRLQVLSESGKSRFGQALAATGDLNSDAIDDFAVAYDGGVFVYQGFLNVGKLAGFSFEISQDVSGDLFGAAMSGGRGQLIGGASGLLVGSPGDSLAGSFAGSAYLFSAGALSNFFEVKTTFSATATASSRFKGLNVAPISLKRLGNSVRMGGDINADGKVDALLGMPLYNGTGSESGGILVEF
jgi:hypothetical protein